MDLVEEMITFLESGFVVFVSLITGISFDDAFDFIDFAGESSGRDEFREFPVNEINRDAKLIGHGLKLDSFVRL